MKLYSTSSVHLTLFVETERFLRHTEQFGFFRLVFVERQTPAIQCFQGEFLGFFSGVGPQFRSRLTGASGENGDGQQQQSGDQRFHVQASWHLGSGQ